MLLLDSEHATHNTRTPRGLTTFHPWGMMLGGCMYDTRVSMGYYPMYMLRVWCRRRSWYLASVYRDRESQSQCSVCRSVRPSEPRNLASLDRQTRCWDRSPPSPRRSSFCSAIATGPSRTTPGGRSGCPSRSNADNPVYGRGRPSDPSCHCSTRFVRINVENNKNKDELERTPPSCPSPARIAPVSRLLAARRDQVRCPLQTSSLGGDMRPISPPCTR